MLEVYVSIEDQLKYYKVSDFPFNFALLNVRGPPVKAEDAKREIDQILEGIPNNNTYNWVVCIALDKPFLIPCHIMLLCHE